MHFVKGIVVNLTSSIARRFGSWHGAREVFRRFRKAKVPAISDSKSCLKLVTVICAGVFLSASGADTPVSADGKGAYATGKHRNLFAEAGHSQPEIRQKIDSLEARHAQGLVAVNAVASLAGTHPRSQKFAAELWNTPTPDGIERYYEGLLYMMALLHCSGEFRVW
jgi:hypothetical protein